MIYTTGGLTNDNRGSIGGITFSKNASNNFARAKKMPKIGYSFAQQFCKSKMQNSSQSWRLLSNNDRIAWTNLAKSFPRENALGQTYYLTGLQMYNYCQLNVMKIGRPPLLAIPDISKNCVVAPYNFVPNFTLTPGSESLKFTIDLPPILNYTGIIACAGIISNGISTPKKFKNIAYIDNTFTSSEDFKSYFTSVFGIMPGIGDKITFSIRYVDETSGFESIVITNSCITHI